MRRRLLLVPALLLLLALPTDARAGEEGLQQALGGTDDYKVCEQPPAGYTVVSESTSTTIDVDSPELPDESVFLNFQLDLYPAFETSSASVNVSLDWGIPVNDFDLYMSDDSGELGASENFQTLGDPPSETVGTASMLHCNLFTIEVYNFLAAGGPTIDQLDTPVLTITTGSVK